MRCTGAVLTQWHAGYHAIPVPVAGAGTDKNNECCTRSAYCSCILPQGMSGSIVGVEGERKCDDRGREGETGKEEKRKRERNEIYARRRRRWRRRNVLLTLLDVAVVVVIVVVVVDN